MVELVQSSIAVAAAYLGWQLVRRPPNGKPTFGALLLAVAALCGLGLLGRELGSTPLGAFGAIGIGAGTCMLVLGPAARGSARRLAARERYTAAGWLLAAADVLAPGSGVAEERVLLGAMREIREGRIDQTVDALTQAKRRAPADARVAIDERIAMLYLAAYRWNEGLAHAEEFLLGQPADPRGAEDAREAAPTGASHLALRRELGIGPPVWIELLGAYARTGDLDRAARMLARFEDACGRRDDTATALWLHRARLMFLALAGRVAAVEVLTGPRAARHLSASARAYWRGVAHERGGDGASASVAYVRARRGARGMPRAQIDEALARIAGTSTAAAGLAPVVLGDEATRVVARVEAAPLPAIARPPGRSIAATAGLVIAIAAAGVVATALVGPTTDFGVMLRAGAMIKSEVLAGQWWRLVTCIGLHAGWIHAGVNMVCLWILGRLAESMFGAARTLAIFAISGLAGAAASCAMNPGPTLGASGAILGLLGAALVELALHRRRYSGLRPTWTALAALAVAQLAYGFVYRQIDQWAHGGGLVAGALAGAALSPSVRWHRVTLWLSRVVAVAALALAIVATVFAARTSAADSLAAGRFAEFSIGGYEVEAPAGWTINDGELYDGAVFIVLALKQDAGDVDLTMAQAKALDAEPDAIRGRGFDDVTTPDDALVSLPDGWTGRELEAGVEDDLGIRTDYRIVVAAARLGDTIVIARLYAPATLVRAAPAFFTRLLASARLPQAPPPHERPAAAP